MDLRMLDGFRDIPAFEFVDGGTGHDLRSRARVLESVSDDLRQTGDAELPAAGAGVTVTRAIEILGQTRQEADRATERHLQTAAAWGAMRSAAEAFLRDSPTDAEIATAAKDLEAAQWKAAETDTSWAELRAARKRFHDLRDRRDAATAEFERAAEKAAEKLPKKPSGDRPEDGNRGRRAPQRGNQTPGAGEGRNLRSPATPRTLTAPAVPAAAPPSIAPTSSGPSAAQAAAVADLLAAAQRPQQAVPFLQQPQPTVAAPAPVAATAPASASQPRNDKANPIDSRAIGDLIDAAPAIAAVAATVPATPPAPATAPATAPAPSGPTGTSHTGLTTDANTSGRAEGAARTGLSAASAEQATGTQAQRPTEAAARPMGGGAPVMGPMGGIGAGSTGGAPKKDAEELLTRYTPDEAELNGHTTQAEAVKGGTIAQRRDGGPR